jgi:hypothetical protein
MTEWKTLATTLLLAASLALSSCAGREPRPVAATHPQDSVMDCAGIQREFEANERQLATTLDERTNSNLKNILFGAVGVTVFLPALFFLDLKTPEKIEINALRNRNGVLAELAKSKKCPVPQTKIQPIYDWMDGKTPPDQPPLPQ